LKFQVTVPSALARDAPPLTAGFLADDLAFFFALAFTARFLATGFFLAGFVLARFITFSPTADLKTARRHV
jgi:hypothetical protein